MVLKDEDSVGKDHYAKHINFLEVIGGRQKTTSQLTELNGQSLSQRLVPRVGLRLDVVLSLPLPMTSLIESFAKVFLVNLMRAIKGKTMLASKIYHPRVDSSSFPWVVTCG